jgi:hypothetical protein
MKSWGVPLSFIVVETDPVANFGIKLGSEMVSMPTDDCQPGIQSEVAL